MILRRKRLPPRLVPAHAAFIRVVAITEDAKVAVTRALPTTRYAGTPMAEALAQYETSLNRAYEMMPNWRVSEVEGEWRSCAEGLRRALEIAGRLRIEAPDLGGFEGLVGVAGELIGALEPFADAERRFRQLRTS
jgi:hypothetical protein